MSWTFITLSRKFHCQSAIPSAKYPHGFSVVLCLKKRCFKSSLSTDLNFLLRISFPLVFLLGCSKARFPSTSTEHSFLVPALILHEDFTLEILPQDPRYSPSPALCMKHNLFYGMRSAFPLVTLLELQMVKIPRNQSVNLILWSLEQLPERPEQ